MTEAAEKAGLVNMVNLTYRNAAALQTARRMIEAGEIGEVRHVQASYLQSWLTGRHWGDWRTEERWLWRLSSEHGSKGVIGDIGVHILDFATYGTGLDIVGLSARMKTFDKAEGGVIDVYRLDVNDSVAMTVEFSNGALGVVHMSRFATGKSNDLDLLDPRRQGRAEDLGQLQRLHASTPASAPTSTPRPGPPTRSSPPPATRSASSSRSSPARTATPTSATPPRSSGSSTSPSSPTPRAGCCRSADAAQKDTTAGEKRGIPRRPESVGPKFGGMRQCGISSSQRRSPRP